MSRKKYTLYVLDKNNRFLKDCIHEYLETVKSFEEHFTAKQLAKIKKIKKRREAQEKKARGKAHKYHK